MQLQKRPDFEVDQAQEESIIMSELTSCLCLSLLFQLCVTASSILSRKKTSMSFWTAVPWEPKDRTGNAPLTQTRSSCPLPRQRDPPAQHQTAPPRGSGLGRGRNVCMWLAEEGPSWLQPSPSVTQTFGKPLLSLTICLSASKRLS